MASTAQLRLLLIDDDLDQRDLTREALEDHFGSGCVDAVGTGAEALIKNLGSYDMILSDFNLPDCTGMELLTQIRVRCQTPVIMVTGENVSEFAAEAIRRGATDYVVKVGDYFLTIPLVVEKNLTVVNLTRENDRLRVDLERALRAVQETNSQLESSLKTVEQLAATDSLTGLYNRRQFQVVLDQLFSEAQRYSHDLSCVMLDLDRYKQLNDAMGHQMGDEVLVLVGRIFKATIRRADIAARYGGDEFVLLLPHADPAEAVRLTERVREQYRRQSADLLATAEATSDRRLEFAAGLTMSIGIASLRINGCTSADDLVSLADAALYASKQNGRDQITTASRQRVKIAG